METNIMNILRFWMKFVNFFFIYSRLKSRLRHWRSVTESNEEHKKIRQLIKFLSISSFIILIRDLIVNFIITVYSVIDKKKSFKS